jgi:hypothetical protein
MKDLVYSSFESKNENVQSFSYISSFARKTRKCSSFLALFPGKPRPDESYGRS